MHGTVNLRYGTGIVNTSVRNLRDFHGRQLSRKRQTVYGLHGLMMETPLPYILYCVAMSGTPGPNNVMVLASAANFGFQRTQPHIWGINIGFSLMMFIIALGLGSVFLAEPRLQLALKVIGVTYMLWLAFKIAMASGVSDGEAKGKPLTFLQGAVFQWVNPKAWMMILGAVSVYGPAGYSPLEKALYLSLVMLIAGSPPTQIWAAFGVGIRRFLQNPKALRAFNITMAALLVLSLIPMLR
jgi:threonine/homoserine/homoserine lactone efflux protein